MRTIPLLFILMIGSVVHGQTDSLERAILFNKVTSGELKADEYSKIGKKWKELIQNINGYPELPFGNDGKIQYAYIITFQNITKQKLYNRTLEWLSITWGIVPAYLYSNFEDGKLICSNSIKIDDNTTGNYTYVITIKEEKILMEFTHIGYQVTSGGYYAGDKWIPESVEYNDINQVFPVILKNSYKWKYYLYLLKKIDEQFNNDMNSLYDYIIDYESRYLF
jgi:hypothetical protein